MEWLLCIQTPYDSVKYVTSSKPDYSYLTYKKFLTFISEMNLSNLLDLVDEIDKFQTIMIFPKQHTWKVIHMEKDTNYSFEELYKINQPEVEEGESKIDKAKKWIFDWYKNERRNKYNR